MSRATVRAQTALYFGGRPQPGRPDLYRDSPVTHLASLYSATPRETPDADFWPRAGRPSGAVAIVHLISSHEARRSFGGGGTEGIPPAGEKRIDYQVYLETYFRSRRDRSEEAFDDFDAFLDSLAAVSRADRTWGTGGREFGKIWQAGETLTIQADKPEWSSNRLYVEIAVVTTVTEWLLS